MDRSTEVQRVAAVLLMIGLAGCGPSEEARRAAAGEAAAAAQAKATTQAGEVISARREAQTFLDSARAAFVAKDFAGASNQLREAATFTRAQSDSATAPAKQPLANAADELDRIATAVSKGAVTSVKTLDNSFVSTQLAEAQFHRTRALSAWLLKDAATTGAEIVMLTDHFERASADAGQPLSVAAQQAISNARALAGKLTQAVAVVPSDVDSVLSTLDKEIHGLMAPPIVKK